ncbi:hypothetical protein Zmor_007412 [Zophobas morio]|uniref:Uncharacterized protein n=1 Tax=Zophobas morio TaxID=2755281 RepID=A0AA38IRY4_9CUCU|nr:hypothetical protein Zmor_007412 [Zophobas morio]
MVSLLLSEEVDTTHTIEELTRSNYLVAMDNHSYTLKWMTSPKTTDIQNLYHTKIINNNKSLNIYSSRDGFKKVGCGGFAYHTDVFTAYSIIGKYFAQEQICHLSQMQMIPPVMTGLVTKKSSQFSELFRISLLKLNEDGLVNKLLNSWKVIRPECYASTEFIPLGMEQSLPALIFLLVGILTSFLILGVEVVLFEKKSD